MDAAKPRQIDAAPEAAEGARARVRSSGRAAAVHVAQHFVFFGLRRLWEIQQRLKAKAPGSSFLVVKLCKMRRSSW